MQSPMSEKKHYVEIMRPTLQPIFQNQEKFLFITGEPIITK